jgi:hypothetical protein
MILSITTLSKMTCDIIAFSKVALGITILCKMTLRKMTEDIISLSIMTFGIMTPSKSDAQHYETHHNDI